MTAETVRQALETHGVGFESTEHPHAVTAQQVAAAEHESGWHVAKPVLLIADGELVMAVLPAALQLDTERARTALGVGDLRLAREDEFAGHFPDCDTGAEPIFGSLYGVQVYVDERLTDEPRLVFAAGNHHETLAVDTNDFLRIVEPARAKLGAAAPEG